MVKRLFSGLYERVLQRHVLPPQPLEPFVAIGDIHGCATLLNDLLTRLKAECPAARIVCVGDYIDRGPQSAEVLARLRALEAEHQPGVTCLLGNHEAMCLEFLEIPSEAGPLWLRNGGRQTLESFGVTATEDLDTTRDQLVAAMGPAMIRWLQALPKFWQSGNVIVSHACGNPRSPMNPNRSHGLLWGHSDSLKMARRDGNWMVHGHFITPNPCLVRGRIPVDTGAFDSGVLTAAVVGEAEVWFVQVHAV